MATAAPSKKRAEIGARLKSERERLGYTAKQIAQLMGVTLDVYATYETGQGDPGVYRLPRLSACGFDVLYILTAERHRPMEEENELLSRFRELSQRGRASVFTTIDALERLAPNLRKEFNKRFRS
ncbi:MAG TPA: helix-turn-helix domain-containing protein [Candidatus Sutterella merdavium]|jgi:transcriptional regulator with XRE-family HTH domain|nr:helix-turn-helix domain-containing protein [Candidatus Sutterella merdavium]